MSSNRYPGLNIQTMHEVSANRSETTVFGFWVYLMSDLIIFGLFFATYIISNNPTGYAGGPTPKDLFNVGSVFAQTMLLLASSFTCGMLGIALKYHAGKGRMVMWLLITGALGLGFLLLELRDFANMWSQGATPMRSAWASGYYALVGLHGLHITAGLLWILVSIGLIIWRQRDARNETRMLMFMLFWHFLDIVWIGIFTIVLLGGLT